MLRHNYKWREPSLDDVPGWAHKNLYGTIAKVFLNPKELEELAGLTKWVSILGIRGDDCLSATFRSTNNLNTFLPISDEDLSNQAG